MDKVHGIKYSAYHQTPGNMDPHHCQCLYHKELNLVIVSTVLGYALSDAQALHSDLNDFPFVAKSTCSHHRQTST